MQYLQAKFALLKPSFYGIKLVFICVNEAATAGLKTIDKSRSLFTKIPKNKIKSLIFRIVKLRPVRWMSLKCVITLSIMMTLGIRILSTTVKM
jgi:hypothetical protein